MGPDVRIRSKGYLHSSPEPYGFDFGSGQSVLWDLTHVIDLRIRYRRKFCAVSQNGIG